jgi:hypothetical protein
MIPKASLSTPPSRVRSTAAIAHSLVRVTQATGLLSPAESTLLTIPKISDRSKFDRWSTEIHFALRLWRLEAIIDNTVERPSETDEDYSNWAFWSRRIMTGMWSHMSEDIKSLLENHPTKHEYADDFKQAVKAYSSRDNLPLLNHLDPGCPKTSRTSGAPSNLDLTCYLANMRLQAVPVHSAQ